MAVSPAEREDLRRLTTTSTTSRECGLGRPSVSYFKEFDESKLDLHQNKKNFRFEGIRPPGLPAAADGASGQAMVPPRGVMNSRLRLEPPYHQRPPLPAYLQHGARGRYRQQITPAAQRRADLRATPAAERIENGAPADLHFRLLSDWMDYLARPNLIKPKTRLNFPATS